MLFDQAKEEFLHLVKEESKNDYEVKNEMIKKSAVQQSQIESNQLETPTLNEEFRQ